MLHQCRRERLFRNVYGSITQLWELAGDGYLRRSNVRIYFDGDCEYPWKYANDDSGGRMPRSRPSELYIMSCPCGMKSGLMNKDWHEAHLRHHLKVYPSVDERTKEVLRECVEQATFMY